MALKGFLATSFLALVLAFSCFAIVGFSPARVAMASTVQSVTIQGSYHQTEAHKMLGLVNRFRTNAVTSAHKGNEPWYWNGSNSERVECKGLGKLEWDYSLEKIAMQRAAEIAAVFSHTRPNGELCFAAKDGNVQSCGENIASGMGWYEDAQSVFVGWREDDDSYSGQGHRRNMLGSRFSAFASACFEVDGVYFWVQEFGYSKSDTPSFSSDDSRVDARVDVDVSNEELSYGLKGDSMSASVGKGFTLPKKLTGVFEPWNGVKVPFSVEASSWRITSGSGCVSLSNGSWCEVVAAGTAVLEVSALGKTATYTIRASRLKASVTGLEKSRSAKVGDSFALKATSNSDSKISWSSSNPAVASVDGNGNVTAKAAGSATIRASVAQTSTHEGASAACEVTVTNPATVAPSKPSGGQSTGGSSASSSKPTATQVAAPKGTSLVKVSKAKKAFTAKWKKASGIKGYQVRWSTKSSMAGAKASTVKSSKTTSKKVGGLKKKTKYYVQVRTYKVVKGKTYWSGWSRAKSVKTK